MRRLVHWPLRGDPLRLVQFGTVMRQLVHWSPTGALRLVQWWHGWYTGPWGVHCYVWFEGWAVRIGTVMRQLVHWSQTGALRLVQWWDGWQTGPWRVGCYDWYSDETVGTQFLDGRAATFCTVRTTGQVGTVPNITAQIPSLHGHNRITKKRTSNNLLLINEPKHLNSTNMA